MRRAENDDGCDDMTYCVRPFFVTTSTYQLFPIINFFQY